ncbi:MarR family transcriptional regulator [Sphingomonas sp. Leaf412]|uniref:MarR family winged helix-turn-helix transcriptional regulator n=1 Tax=Sphingomonas sp. Leaf412 TaxID=1736370 RepID=UPI0006F2C9B9|nr:MarR family transcriptional regulator [Sphingomonas sp. Leaf412]KQT33418.1 MarR family transcriptional regulator [Sphingomonas sp. Leaf412]
MSPPLPLDDQLCYALYAASMAVQRVYKPMLDELGITYPQYLVLHTLWEEDGRTIGGIAERLSLDSSTVTPLVKRLEAAAFVARRRDTQDERRVDVRLTPRGRALRAACGCLGETLVARAGIDLPDLGTLSRDVRRLRTALAGDKTQHDPDKSLPR